MKNSDSALGAIAEGIVDGIESLVQEAQRATQPLELDPHRSKLFEFFVTADAAGYLSEDREPNLSSDSLCHLLAQRWGLSDAARNSVSEQTRLQPDQLDSMRMLWSVMRMWMEWTYAWQRWSEFHR
ncbi:MAG: hypothetical protein ABGZ17_13585 [Planctomycetaceae bacterium]